MRKSLLLLMTAVIAAALGGCDRISASLEKARAKQEEAAGKPSKPPEVVFPVEVTPPARRDLHAFLKTSANVEAERQVDVVSEGVGQCLRVNVEEGDTVTAGQVLAELDQADLEAQVRQSTVNVRQQELAYERTSELWRQGLASDMEHDNARFALEQARATLESQEVRLGNQTIHAPIGGVVTRRGVQKGMLVSSGVPAFTIVDPASYVLPIYVWEGALHRVAVGQDAIITADSLPGEEFTATVRRINPGVEQGGKVKVILEFDDTTRALLREGLYARVRLVTDVREDALAVPKDAVVEENARTYLMVAVEAPPEPEAEPGADEDAEAEAAPPQADQPAAMADAGAPEEAEEPPGPRLVAERVEVELGLEDADHVEILSGIDEQARVITLGQHTVKPGARVRITSVEAEVVANADLDAAAALEAAEEEAAKKANRPGPPGPGPR